MKIKRTKMNCGQCVYVEWHKRVICVFHFDYFRFLKWICKKKENLLLKYEIKSQSFLLDKEITKLFVAKQVWCIWLEIACCVEFKIEFRHFK